MISKEIPISDEKHLDPGKSELDVNWLRSILMDLELAYYALWVVLSVVMLLSTLFLFVCLFVVVVVSNYCGPPPPIVFVVQGE